MNQDNSTTLTWIATVIVLVMLMLIQKKLYENGLDAAYGRANDIQAEVRQLRERAIQHGCAHYNATTGQFQWVETNKESKP